MGQQGVDYHAYLSEFLSVLGGWSGVGDPCPGC